MLLFLGMYVRIISRKETTLTKVGIVVLADTETHGDLGRIANALTSAKEF